MPGLPPPNSDLAELASLLGPDNVRLLVRTFLHEYPMLLQEMSTGDRKTRQRIVHSLKSNARVIGARDLSARMAVLEERLGRANEPDLKPAEIAAISTDFNTFADGLRPFAEVS